MGYGSVCVSTNGEFCGEGPRVDNFWLIQPLIWEAYDGTAIFNIPFPAQIQQHLQHATRTFRTQTDVWPNTVDQWLANDFLLRRRIISDFLTQASIQNNSVVQGLNQYHDRLIQAIRLGINPILVEFDSNR